MIARRLPRARRKALRWRRSVGTPPRCASCGRAWDGSQRWHAAPWQCARCWATSTRDAARDANGESSSSNAIGSVHQSFAECITTANGSSLTTSPMNGRPGKASGPRRSTGARHAKPSLCEARRLASLTNRCYPPLPPTEPHLPVEALRSRCQSHRSHGRIVSSSAEFIRCVQRSLAEYIV